MILYYNVVIYNVPQALVNVGPYVTDVYVYVLYLRFAT